MVVDLGRAKSDAGAHMDETADIDGLLEDELIES